MNLEPCRDGSSHPCASKHHESDVLCMINSAILLRWLEPSLCTPTPSNPFTCIINSSATLPWWHSQSDVLCVINSAILQQWLEPSWCIRTPSEWYTLMMKSATLPRWLEPFSSVQILSKSCTSQDELCRNGSSHFGAPWHHQSDVLHMTISQILSQCVVLSVVDWTLDTNWQSTFIIAWTLMWTNSRVNRSSLLLLFTVLQTADVSCLWSIDYKVTTLLKNLEVSEEKYC